MVSDLLISNVSSPFSIVSDLLISNVSSPMITNSNRDLTEQLQ
jgi:hypothetical protein